MEDLIKEIDRLTNHGSLPSDDEIERLMKLFQERGVSIMTLEKLLNFYTLSKRDNDDDYEELFVDPTAIIDTSVDILQQEKNRLKYQLKHAIEKNERIEKQLIEIRTKLKWVVVITTIIIIGLITWIATT